MNEYAEWTELVASHLDLDPALVGELSDPVLDLVRDIAHGVSRPAAPLTAFLVGLASSAGGQRRPDDGAPTVSADLVRARLDHVRTLLPAPVASGDVG